MNPEITSALEFVQGPVFRFSFAIMILGFLRAAVIGGTEMGAAFLMADRKDVWARFGYRILWFFFPHVLLKPMGQHIKGWSIYHAILSMLSLIFRMGAVILPAFMVAHVYLWKRGLGISWPALPPGTADTITFIIIGAGLLAFLGRLYSSVLRKIEPAWAFLCPLILIAPFVTGVFAMHPTWSPFGYHTVLLLHTLSACLVFVLLPFAGLLSFMHTPVTKWIPKAAWRYTPEEQPTAQKTPERELVPA